MSGVYLFDKSQNLIATVKSASVFENTQTIELGGQITAVAKMKYSAEYEDAQFFGVKGKGNFWLYKIRTLEKSDGQITLNGIHIFYDDLKGVVIRDIRPQNVKANLALERILYGTDWKIGAISVSKIASSNYYYQSALSAFYESVKTWDYEFIPRVEFSKGKIIGKYVDIYDEISRDNGKWYEYGDKLVDVVAESSVDELYTAFIGRGKGLPTEDENGELTGGYSRKLKFDGIAYSNKKGDISVTKPIGIDYIEIKSATNLYGYPDGSPRIGVVDFDDIEDAKELAEATFEYAINNSRPKLQLRATALEGENVELGETVRIIRPDMNMRYKVRVFKIKKDFLQNKIVSYEFGDKVVLSTGERLKSEAFEKKRKQEELQSYIDALRDEINSSYFNEDGYNYELKIGNKYGLPAGYYSFDRPIDENPTKVIYVGAGKMLIANSKKPDGSWDFKTAATGDGLLAERIVGTLGEFAKINANQINVNSDFYKSPIGKKIEDKADELSSELDSTKNSIETKIDVVTGNLVTLDGKVVKLNVPYNNVKITPEKGLQVLDNANRERLQLGNWASGRYGLKLVDASGRNTILDDQGILQSWQDGRCDNADEGHPLRLFVYLPRETARIYVAKLRVFVDSFRAYSKSISTERANYTSTDGGDLNEVFGTTDYRGDIRDTTHGMGHVNGDNITVPVYSNTPGWTGNVTIYHVYSHEHSVEIPGHSHQVAVRTRPHRHEVRIPGHSHEIMYGIYEESNSDNNMEIFINGTDRTSSVAGKGYFSGNIEDGDITQFLSRGGWNTVEIRTRKRMRIDATVYIQALLNYGGY